MARIFISHSSKNNAPALVLRDWIIAGGWDDHPFLDLDPERGIAAGERWERALHEAADRCEVVLFLVSRAWIASEWCLKEFHLAQKLNKRVFGVLIEDIPTSDLLATLTAAWQVVNLAAGNDHDLFRAVLPDLSREEHVTFSRSGLARLKAGLDKAGLDPRFFAWPPAGEPDRAPGLTKPVSAWWCATSAPSHILALNCTRDEGGHLQVRQSGDSTTPFIETSLRRRHLRLSALLSARLPQRPGGCE